MEQITLVNMANFIISMMKENSYQDVTSSRANSTPPTGALKAAATPAAHPHVTF